MLLMHRNITYQKNYISRYVVNEEKLYKNKIAIDNYNTQFKKIQIGTKIRKHHKTGNVIQKTNYIITVKFEDFIESFTMADLISERAVVV